MILSIVINYFNNASALALVIENYRNMSECYLGLFELILVDDHSTEMVDHRLFENVPNLRVFRVKENVAWNMSGARNIGAMEARCRRIFFADVDHIVEPEEVAALLRDAASLPLGQRLTPARRRAFGQIVDGETLIVNINCFLINRQDFFRVGGYEEIFSGHYGREDKFFKQCCKIHGVRDDIASFKLSHMMGHATKDVVRDKSRNDVVIGAIMRTNTVKASKAFTFDYEQIFPPRQQPLLPPIAAGLPVLADVVGADA